MKIVSAPRSIRGRRQTGFGVSVRGPKAVIVAAQLRAMLRAIDHPRLRRRMVDLLAYRERFGGFTPAQVELVGVWWDNHSPGRRRARKHL